MTFRLLGSLKPKMAPNIGIVKFDFKKSLWLWINMIIGIPLGLPRVDLNNFTVGVLLAILTLCIGHSVGLHRGIIHQTYKTTVWFQNLLTTLFIFSGLGGPLSWITVHAQRDYWQNRPDCPSYFHYHHPLWIDFIWNLHYSHTSRKNSYLKKVDPMLFSNKYLLFLENHWMTFNALFAILIYLIFSFDDLCVLFFLRNTIGVLGHWFIGYCSHKWGVSPKLIEGAAVSGTNNLILGIISFGEGFHNNHHTFPTSAKMGIYKNQWDLGWYFIKLFNRMKLIGSVKVQNTEIE